jgi:hypothetical protein
MTQIVDHGKWMFYQPDALPEYAPSGALFVRRESDGVDWYVYSRDSRNFSPDTVKFTALWQDIHNGYTIGAAARDPTRLFPAGALLREIVDYHGGDDPQLELGARLYNPDSNKLHDRPPPPTFNFDFQGVLDRLAAIEAKLGIVT